MRLNKFIATNSEYSRRKADELISLGKVYVNDKKITKLGETIDPENDKIKINGKTIESENERIYLALNKPKGYITTRDDEQKRKTVMELLPKIKNLKPAGRLDKDTEGLLLFSNDGEFINKITHPKYECEKEYFVIIEGELSEKNQEKLEKGVRIDNRKTHPSKITIIKKLKTETSLKIKIHEGRNRQVRKMFATINQNVKYLQRIRIGKISLGSLKKGKYRPLSKLEINVK